MILFTITNTFAAKLFATKLSIMSCLFSHSLLNILAHLPPQYNCFEKCRGSWKNWRPGISYSNPIPVLIPVCEIANSGMGRELKKSIPTIREREGNEKNPFPQFGNGKGMKKIHSHNSGMGIRGFNSWEWTGTGIPAHPCNNKEEELAAKISKKLAAVVVGHHFECGWGFLSSQDFEMTPLVTKRFLTSWLR